MREERLTELEGRLLKLFILKNNRTGALKKKKSNIYVI